MATTLSVIKPSVNNMTARVFLRAAGLDFSERDVFGNTRSPEYLATCPAHLTPMIEIQRSAEGRAVGELRHHAISVQQA